jgi:hypothetical protein
LSAVLLGNFNFEQIILPINLLLPQINEVATGSSKLLFLREASRDELRQVNFPLSQLQDQQHFEVYQVLCSQGFESLFVEEITVWQRMN